MFGQLIEIVSYWLHLLGAAAWIGGLFFYLTILKPTLKNVSPPEARKFMELAGVRFRAMGLILLGLMLLTGLFQTNWILQAAGDRTEFFGSTYGRLLGVKISISLLVMAISAWIALGPVPGMVSALEARDEIRARSRGRLILYFSGLVLILSILIGLCVASIRLSV